MLCSLHWTGARHSLSPMDATDGAVISATRRFFVGRSPINSYFAVFGYWWAASRTITDAGRFDTLLAEIDSARISFLWEHEQNRTDVKMVAVPSCPHHRPKRHLPV